MKILTVFLAVFLLACGTPSAAQPTPAATPTVVSTTAPVTAVLVTSTDAPTAGVLATIATDAPAPTAELATEAPAGRATTAPAPTSAPAEAPADSTLGVAPSTVKDCPADHPVKGNIQSSGKGEKIYHLPGGSGYAATHPERCFTDAKEAEAAGFRPVK